MRLRGRGALHHERLLLDRNQLWGQRQTLYPVGSEDPEGADSRGDSVEAAGPQLQEAVPPGPPGHPEVVDRAPEDQELVPLQGEVRLALRRAFRLKSHRTVLQLQRGQM